MDDFIGKAKDCIGSLLDVSVSPLTHRFRPSSRKRRQGWICRGNLFGFKLQIVEMQSSSQPRQGLVHWGLIDGGECQEDKSRGSKDTEQADDVPGQEMETCWQEINKD